MARIYVGRLRDGDTIVDVVLWDVRGAAPAGPQVQGIRPPSLEAASRGALDLAAHVRRIDGARDGDVAELLCDLIERSWDHRTLRH